MAITASQAARLSGSGRERVKKSSMLLLFLCLSKYAIAEARASELPCSRAQAGNAIAVKDATNA
jgi:hypothetical protein